MNFLVLGEVYFQDVKSAISRLEQDACTSTCQLTNSVDVRVNKQNSSEMFFRKSMNFYLRQLITDAVQLSQRIIKE